MRVAHPEICNPHYKMYSVNEASKCLAEHVTVVGCNRSGCRLRRNAVNLYGLAFLSRGIGFQSSGSDSEIAVNLYAARFACFARGGVGLYAARNGYTDIRITVVLVYHKVAVGGNAFYSVAVTVYYDCSAAYGHQTVASQQFYIGRV